MIRICCRHSCVNSWFTIIQPFQANCFKCKLYKHLDRPLSYRCSWPTFERIRFYITIRSPPVSIHVNANAFINISDDLSVKKARRTFFCRTVFWLRLRSLILFNIKMAILYLSRFQKTDKKAVQLFSYSISGVSDKCETPNFNIQMLKLNVIQLANTYNSAFSCLLSSKRYFQRLRGASKIRTNQRLGL